MTRTAMLALSGGVDRSGRDAVRFWDERGNLRRTLPLRNDRASRFCQVPPMRCAVFLRPSFSNRAFPPGSGQTRPGLGTLFFDFPLVSLS